LLPTRAAHLVFPDCTAASNSAPAILTAQLGALVAAAGGADTCLAALSGAAGHSQGVAAALAASASADVPTLLALSRCVCCTLL
jgi:malonyl CoA-acyl carrier protein transacylase